MIALLCVISVCITALAGTYMVLRSQEPEVTKEAFKEVDDILADHVGQFRHFRDVTKADADSFQDRLLVLEAKEAERESAATLKKGFKI